jgi:hypothetical protein
MTPLVKSLLINGIVDLVLIGLSLAAPGVWLLLFAVAVIQVLFSLILLVSASTRQSGQGMLIIGGLALLIGFSLCSGVSFG